jgi:hypothetical protein
MKYAAVERGGSSAMKNEKKTSALICVYLTSSVSCLLLSTVIELLSDGVSSTKLVFSFMCPLIGCLPIACMLLIRGGETMTGRMRIYNFGIAVMTIGCLTGGIADIYGKTDYFSDVVIIAGGTAAAVGAAMMIRDRVKETRKMTHR